MRRLAVVVSMVALTAGPALAQNGGNLGLGLGLQNTNTLIDEEFELFGSLTPNIYVPIALGDNLIIEPGVGFLRLKTSEESIGGSEFTWSAIRLGVGVLFAFATPERGRIYAGPRVGVMRLSSTNEFDGDEFESTRMDLLFSAVLGGEFFLMPAFSLGGEAGLTYLSVGDTDREPEPDFAEESEASMLSLGTEFRVRWYIR